MNVSQFSGKLAAIEGDGHLDPAAKAAAISALANEFAQSAQQASNLEALRNTGGASSFVPGEQGASAGISEVVIKSAQAFEPKEPTEDERQNPPKWAYDNFIAAGIPADEVNQPNGPDDRFGAELAQHGGSKAANYVWVAAFKYVLSTYAAGTAKIKVSEEAVPTTHDIGSVSYDPSSYTDEQKMTMQYIAVGNVPNRGKAQEDLDRSLGGDGVNHNLRYVSLDQMFSAEGKATLYNPLAGSAVSALLKGESEAAIRERFDEEAKFVNSKGFTDSYAQLTPTWFEQARAIIAKYA